MRELVTKNRKFGLRIRLRLLALRGSAEAKRALHQLDQFFDFVADQYLLVVPEALDSQTPWLDAIRDFFQWLDESGLLQLLLQLFFGIPFVADATEAEG